MLTNEIFAQGALLREPVGATAGFWTGAPGALYDEADRAWYLTYRIRRPRGVAPDRGGEVRIARSTDLEQWDDVVTINKAQYDSASIERSCLHRGKDGEWRYFTSYVDADGRWGTAVTKAHHIAELDPARRKILYTAAAVGLEGVKDPWILEENGSYFLFLSVAVPTPSTRGDSHASLDIFNTGDCKSATALAVSADLDHWEWQGVVFAPGETGWDAYCRRINSVVPLPGKAGLRYLGFYDGCASHAENYEEKCALAVSTDLRQWQPLSLQGPTFTSPYASHSLRYVDARFGAGKWHLFYEFARPDGSHDLRLTTCSTTVLAELLR